MVDSRFVPTRWRTAVPVVLLVLTACHAAPSDGTVVGESRARSDVSSFLTGDAVNALGDSGLFRMLSSDEAVVSAARMRALALAWAREYATQVLPYLVAGHGREIRPNSLWACGRVYLAEGSADGAAIRARAGLGEFEREVGNWWLVTLCGDDGVPQVSIALSEQLDGIAVSDGGLNLPPGGTWIRWEGLPFESGALPIPPEEAVRQVSLATGRKVDRVPTLVMRPRAKGSLARWKVHLSQPVSVVIAGATRQVQTDEVFVAVEPKTFRLHFLVRDSTTRPTAVFPQAPPQLDGGADVGQVTAPSLQEVLLKASAGEGANND